MAALVCRLFYKFMLQFSGIGTAISGNGLAETPLIIAANDDVKKRFLGRMIDEPLVAVIPIYCLYKINASSLMQ